MEDLFDLDYRIPHSLLHDFPNLMQYEACPSFPRNDQMAATSYTYPSNEFAGEAPSAFNLSDHRFYDICNESKQACPTNYVGLTLDTTDSSLRLHHSLDQDRSRWELEPELTNVDQDHIFDASSHGIILHGEPIPKDQIPEGFVSSRYIYQAYSHPDHDLPINSVADDDALASHFLNRYKKVKEHKRKGEVYAGWYDLESTSKLDKHHVLHLMGPLWGYSDDRDGKKCARRRMSKYITPDLARLILDNKDNEQLLKEIAAQTPPLIHSPLNVDEQLLRQHLKDRGMHINSVSMYMKKAKKISMEHGIPLHQAVLSEAARYRPEKKDVEKRKMEGMLPM